MKLTSKFEAGADTSDIFRQLLRGMIAQVRKDMTARYRTIRDLVNQRGSYSVEEFDNLDVAGGELRIARACVYCEHKPRSRESSRALTKAHKAYETVLNRERSRGNYSPTPKLVQLEAAWAEALEAYNKETEEYNRLWANRRYISLSIAQSDKAIRQMVNIRIKELFEGFIAKQTDKVNDVIKGRAGKVSGTVNPSIWESYLHVELSDGSNFDMKMKVVDKVSSRGREFWQFPTTFHKALTGTGKRVWSSEQALKETL